MLDLQTAYLSRTGRRKRNEDACGYWTSAAGCCWVVSDGAGGHGSGDRAAQLVVSSVLDGFSRQAEVSENAAISLLEAAQAAVMAEKAAHPEGDDMHATAAILLIDAQRCEAVWSHVGDTRIYLFREHVLQHQTRDHSMVQNMINAGYCSPEMSRNHPMRSLLTSAIGDAGNLELTVSGPPIAVGPGDAFLICSDGWWEYVDEQGMASELATAGSAAEWLERMAARVEAHDNPLSDNYSAITLLLDKAEIETTVIIP
jgi:PPM family protein phosphatase